MKLTAKQKLFVKEYLIDLNATQAAIRAGYSSKTANEQGARLLANVSIQAAIQAAMSKREQRTEITADRVLRELAAVGFAQAVDVVRVVSRETNNGHVYQTVEIIETDQLPADTKIAIAAIKEGKHGIEVKMHDKLKALEMLGRHLGLFDDSANKDKPDPQAQITALADLINNPAPERVLSDD
ncbi:terminase [Paenibacillus montaniterrae]|uniref:Terminase n=1 Tax=Paenibacillus montaniterrae TaxID=429341 RepID=A0A919YI91_9BACL|nr:terminase small subunit [Paenibacillus montaniterrae]GIP14383.1 terminase [Paenibacillus montaniterrae]